MNLPTWSEITYINEANEEKIDFKKLKAMIKSAAATVQDSEICWPAVLHFNLFHDKTPSDKFIIFFFGSDKQKFQLSYTKKSVTPKLLTTLVGLSHKFRFNLYMSEFCFITGKNRKESNVASTSVVTFDLDKKNVDINVELPRILDICKKNNLSLSAVMSSGRGHYLVFKLDDPYICATSLVQLNRWKHNYNLICDLFQDYEADYKCKDISRVFRLMGSYNYKDNTQYETKFLKNWDVSNAYAEIPICKKTIDDKLFEKVHVPFDSEKKVTKRRQSIAVTDDAEFLQMSENSCFKNQNKKRLNDLIHLICLRQNHLGDRHLFLYTIINQLNVSGYTYAEAFKFITEKVNPKFSLPESEYEIARQLQFIYKQNRLKKETIDRNQVEYIDNHYRSNTTAWIIDTLKITEAEQEKLSVLKSKDSLKKLRQERRLARSRCRTQKKKDAIKKELNAMAETYSVEEIAETANVSKATVYKKLNKTPKQLQKEKEDAQICHLSHRGFSIAAIAEQTGLSYDVVKKRLQRMKNKHHERVESIEIHDEIVLEKTPTFNMPKGIRVFADLAAYPIIKAAESPPNYISNTLAEKT